MNLIANTVVVNDLNNKKVTISWDADSDPSTTNYRIYRSAIPYGTFALIATVNSSTLSYQDTIPLIPYNEYFYYVVAYNGSEGARPQYGMTFRDEQAMAKDPFTDQSPYVYPDYSDMQFFFEEIRRRHLWLLEQDGENVKLLKRRFEGTKCPLVESESEQCPNPLGKPIGTNACYGTNFVGGFYPYLDIKMRIGLANTGLGLQNEGFRIANKPKLWTIYVPIINVGDLIITQENKRYEIVNTLRTAQRGMLLHQECEVELLSASDIRYKVTV